MGDMRLNQHSMHSIMKPSMGMSMKSQMSQHDNIDRSMDLNRERSNMRDMYRDNQDMTSNRMGQDMSPNMRGRIMMGQESSSNIRDLHRQNQAFGPNQYMVKDDFGNYAIATMTNIQRNLKSVTASQSKDATHTS